MTLFLLAGLGIGAVILITAAFVAMSALTALVTWLLWGWIIVPTFALPQLTIWQAFGLGIVVSWLTQYIPLDAARKDKSEINYKMYYGGVFLRIGLVLLLGWITHFFV